MSHDHFEELLGAYALHALDEDERASVERHLASCPRCRAEVQALEEVASLLGSDGREAPPGIWEAISQELDGAPPPVPLRFGALRPPRGRRPLVILATAAAAVVAALGLLAVHSVRQDHRIDELQTALGARPDAGLEDARSAPGAREVRLTSDDGTASVPAIVLPDGSAYLVGSTLPDLPPGTTYQLWGRTDAGYVSLAVLGSAPDLGRFRVEPGTRALAITQERQPGAVQPSTAPIVAGDLQ